jgi:hypothetical protein
MPELKRGLKAGLDPSHLLRLGRASEKPALMEPVLRLLGAEGRKRSPGDAWGEWIAYVDESDYDMRSWVIAVQTLEAWLRSRKLAAASHDVIAYIGCASEAGGLQPVGKSLRDLSVDFLNDFGFESAERSLGDEVFR